MATDRDGTGSGQRFVVQRHGASHLHFDLRLEVDGVLVSWSVPKGPSLDPRDRRLAVRTEDQPVADLTAGGRLTSGYGAGRFVVWDLGTYRNLTGHESPSGDPVPMSRAVGDGRIVVWLDGEKLTGAFAITRTNTRDGRQEKWLLVKRDDDGADRTGRPARTMPRSVLSGHVPEDLGGGSE